MTPISRLAAIQKGDLLDNLSVNLITPVAIIHSFIHHFRNVDSKKTIVNISSGASLKGYAGWSPYCAGKAGCENFINAVALEEQEEVHPFTVMNFDPDVMNTAMQTEIRNAEVEHFPQKQRFNDFRTSGRLRNPLDVARQLHALISNDEPLKRTRYAMKDL